MRMKKIAGNCILYFMMRFLLDSCILSLGPTGPVLSVATIDCNSGYGSDLPTYNAENTDILGIWHVINVT
jgi:hypothetical protein